MGAVHRHDNVGVARGLRSQCTQPAANGDLVVVGGKVHALHEDLRRADYPGFTLKIGRNFGVGFTDYCDASRFYDSDLFPGDIELRITKPRHMVQGYIRN